MNLIGKTDLPTFGGSQKENVRIFFETFETLSPFYKQDDERRLQALPITINKTANYFYEKPEIDIKSFYKKLRIALTKRFSTALTRYKEKEELYSLK